MEADVDTVERQDYAGAIEEEEEREGEEDECDEEEEPILSEPPKNSILSKFLDAYTHKKRAHISEGFANIDIIVHAAHSLLVQLLVLNASKVLAIDLQSFSP